MKILVIALSGIGDTLIATPLIHELRANFPDAQIDALVMWAGARDLLEGNPHLNRVWQKNMIKAGPLKSLPFVFELRRQRYDVLVLAHTQGRLQYRFVARLIGARLRVSHSYFIPRWIDRLLVQRQTPEDYTVHSIENNNRLLPLVGARVVRPEHPMELFLTPDEENWARDYAVANLSSTRRILGVHVGSGGTKNLAFKRWPLDHWIELLRRLATTRPELAIVLFGGPEEQTAHARIRAELPNARLFTPESKNLRQAAALMRHCHAFLSVDTALMHLAAAMRVPNQVVIEAPTLNATNLPHGNHFTVVPNPALGGRNLEYYRYDGGPIKGTDAELIALMSSVTVDSVFAAVTKALGGN
jgi:ADP-heptose:LPS heptosyltransferase